MRFWYFMYGTNVNTLTVFATNAVNDNPHEIWSLEGSQFDGWMKAEIAFTEGSKFRVSGTSATSASLKILSS